MRTCCFSGYRPNKIFGYARNAYMGLIQQLMICIVSLYKQGYRRFITGGAQGFDQLCFWAIDHVKQTYPDIQNVLYLPFNGQESKWAIDGLFGQTEYNQMKNKADEIKIISDTAGIPALFMRNTAMLLDSDAVLCLYNGDDWKDPKTKGGTAGAIREATTKHMINVYQICFNPALPAPYPIKTLQTNIFK